ncbi:uncharacterized protein LOC106667988 [Cimex lectularius]|uniref:Histone-lysine N-methyltransferase, H3 lysine-79 specific n=1 Tax=Cimex lectularius TaxID=79782 RepID=A0A8I6TIE9_CIMLE|nr:uncharacterized protein LOC106667988 [Cimex lectularius]
MEAASNEVKHLKLKLTNPARNKNIEYKFLENPDVGNIILDVIRLAREQYPQLDCLLSETVLRRYDITKHKSLNTLCAYFNRSIRHLFYNVPYPLENTANKSLLEKIFSIVVKEKHLPKDVFNDKNFESVCNIFESLNLTENDSICNIGTGIGEIILQLASYLTPCSKIVGLMENCIPEHSKMFHIHFQQYADWFGKKNKKIHFIWPDCFSLPQFVNQIGTYTIIFIGESILEREILLNMISLLNENTKIYSTSLILEMKDSLGLECLTSTNEHYPFIYMKKHTETTKLLGDSLINSKTEIRKLSLEHNLEEENLQKNSCDFLVKDTESSIECINNGPLKIFTEDLNDAELSDSNFIGVQTRRSWAEWCRNKVDFQVNNISKDNSDLDRRVKQNDSFSRKHRFKKSQISRSKLARTNKVKDNLEKCDFNMEDGDEEPRISGIPIDVYEKMYTILYKKVEFFSIKCPTFLLKGHDEQFNESCFNSSDIGTKLD